MYVYVVFFSLSYYQTGNECKMTNILSYYKQKTIRVEFNLSIFKNKWNFAKSNIDALCQYDDSVLFVIRE